MRATLFLFFLTAFPLYALFESGTFFLGTKNINPPISGDFREPTLSIAYGGKSKYLGQIGRAVSIFRVKDDLGKDFFNFGLTAKGVFFLGKSGVVFPLEYTDGYFGFFYEFVFDAVSIKLSLMHHSAHYSDGTQPIPQTRVNVSREYIQALAFYKYRYLRIHAGGAYDFHIVPTSKRSHIQYGFELRYPNIGGLFGVFAATDFQLHESRKWRQSNSVNGGLFFQSDIDTDQLMKLFVGFYYGRHMMGQKYNEDIEFFHGGFSFPL